MKHQSTRTMPTFALLNEWRAMDKETFSLRRRHVEAELHQRNCLEWIDGKAVELPFSTQNKDAE